MSRDKDKLKLAIETIAVQVETIIILKSALETIERTAVNPHVE